MAERCTALRADKTGPCTCAYFVLAEEPDHVNTSGGSQ